MTRGDAPHRGSPPDLLSFGGDRPVEQWAEGHDHLRGDEEAHPVGARHRAGEHDPSGRGRADQLADGGRDVDPPVTGSVRSGPGVEPAHDRPSHRHPQRRHGRWVWCRGRRWDRSLGHGGRRGDRDQGPDRQQHAEQEQRPATDMLNGEFGMRRQHGYSRQSRRQCAFGMPRTLPGGICQRAGIHEIVDSSSALEPASVAVRPPAGRLGLVSARPASWPGAGARPWCASGTRATR
jgi:hypothetical protein